MSRRNNRQGKARRRAERNRRQVTEREPKRPVSPGQDPVSPGQDLRAAGDQTAPPAGDPGEPGLGADVDLENADPGDFGDLDPADADLRAVLAEEDLGEADLGDFGDLAGDADVPEEPGDPEDSQPGEPSADARAAGPVGTGTRVGEPSPNGAGESEEIVVLGDDDDDLPAAKVLVAGATADPVKDYLKQIGKVRLLDAAQEVELAKRIEAGLFAEEKLAGSGGSMQAGERNDLEWVAEDGRRAKDHLLEANLRLVVSLAKR